MASPNGFMRQYATVPVFFFWAFVHYYTLERCYCSRSGTIIFLAEGRYILILLNESCTNTFLF